MKVRSFPRVDETWQISKLSIRFKTYYILWGFAGIIIVEIDPRNTRGLSCRSFRKDTYDSISFSLLEDKTKKWCHHTHLRHGSEVLIVTEFSLATNLKRKKSDWSDIARRKFKRRQHDLLSTAIFRRLRGNTRFSKGTKRFVFGVLTKHYVFVIFVQWLSLSPSHSFLSFPVTLMSDHYWASRKRRHRDRESNTHRDKRQTRKHRDTYVHMYMKTLTNVYATQLLEMSDTHRLFLRHDSARTHLRHDSFKCTTYLLHVWCNSFIAHPIAGKSISSENFCWLTRKK